MRLPWPSRRTTGRPTGDAAASAAAGPGARPPTPPVGRSEWRGVGRLQPTFAADPGILVQRFQGELAGSQLPPPILRPLGHQRSADGPAGLVSGITRPVIARVVEGQQGTGSLPLAHKRRGATMEDHAPAAEATSAGAEPLPTLPSVAPRRAAAVTGTPVVARSMVTAPATVGRAGPAGPSAPTNPLAGQRPGTPDAPLVAHTGPLASSMPVSAATASGPTVAPPMRTILRSPGGSRVRLGPPIARDAGAPQAASAAFSAPPTSAADEPTRVTVARTVGPEHRAAGAASDAPLAGGLQPSSPALAVASAVVQASDSEGPPVGRVLARVMVDPPGPMSGAPDAPGSSPDAPATLVPTVGSLPLTPTSWPLTARTGSTTRDTGAIRGTSAALAASPARDALATDARATPATSSGTVPGRASLQRSANIGSAASAAPGASKVSNARPVRGMTSDGRMAIPASAGPLDRGEGRAVLAHELVHLQQQRSLGVAMPPAGSESAHRLEAAARTAEAHASWQDLSLARPLGRSMSDPGSVAVARPVGAVTAPTLHTTLQLAEGDPPPPAPDSTGITAAAGSAAQAGAAAAGATGLATQLSDRDMDEMLRKLYPRLRRHLSSELLVARERAGVLADLR
jgi:hypothetical protein